MAIRTGNAGNTGSTGSQAVERAAALLRAIVESDRPRSFTSLVEEQGLAKSTTSRLLHALERNRLVHRDRSGSFRPGPLFDTYAGRRDPLRELRERAEPVLRRLGELTGETINLAVPRGGSLVQIAQVDSRYLLGATNWVGVDVPAHCSAAGKLFYAYGAMPRPRGDLPRRTPATLANREQLDRELEKVARLGWAVASEELEPGLVAIAAPVRAADASVVAAVSVSGPTTRITQGRVPLLAATLVAEARGLSELLGHHERPNDQPGGHARRHGKEGAA